MKIKVGIVVDNYKLKKFEETLRERGFTDFKTSPFTKNATTIQIHTEQDNAPEIGKICRLLDMHFKHAN